MKYHVCIKEVPDVSAPSDSGRRVLNAYDASAVEESLKLRDKYGGEIWLVLIGPTSAREAIRLALAMGADAATHLVVETVDQLDCRAIAGILCDHFKSTPFDVILCGKQAQDTDAGLTGPMLAELLGLPYATNAVGLDWESDLMVVKRQGDTGQEMIALATPCLVTCSNDLNDPRIPSLKGTIGARKKVIDVRTVDHFPDVKIQVTGLDRPLARKKGETLSGEPPEQLVDMLVNRLQDAKVF